MRLLRLIEFLHRHLKAVIRVGIAILCILAALDAIPGIVDKRHAHTAIEHLPAFWCLFGFLGCVLIIFVSKAFGHAGIMTREDYYDE
jgi:hypothetical protein